MLLEFNLYPVERRPHKQWRYHYVSKPTEPPRKPRSTSVDRAFDIVNLDFSKFDDPLLQELGQRIQDELEERGIFNIVDFDLSKLNDERLGKFYRRVRGELIKRGFVA